MGVLINDEVIKEAQQGNEEALNLILEEYKKLVLSNVKNYFIIGAEQEDLIQEGMIGLLKAVRNYDKDKKASFKTFATVCIRTQLITVIRTSTAQKNLILNEAVGNGIENESGVERQHKVELNMKYNPEIIFFCKEKIKEFSRFVKENFSPFEIVVFNFMIKGFSYKEIAEKLEKKPKTIDNAFQRIKKKSELWLNNY